MLFWSNLYFDPRHHVISWLWLELDYCCKLFASVEVCIHRHLSFHRRMVSVWEQVLGNLRHPLHSLLLRYCHHHILLHLPLRILRRLHPGDQPVVLERSSVHRLDFRFQVLVHWMKQLPWIPLGQRCNQPIRKYFTGWKLMSKNTEKGRERERYRERERERLERVEIAIKTGEIYV